MDKTKKNLLQKQQKTNILKNIGFKQIYSDSAIILAIL